MKINQIPKQEDVIRYEYGDHQISVVPVTHEITDHLAQAAFSMYLGEKCKYCGKEYKTLADLKGTVWAGMHKNGRLACRSCWAANNKVDDTQVKNGQSAQNVKAPR